MASKIIVDQLQTTSLALNALMLPVANATANQYLQDNGSGVLSWSTVSASGFSSVIAYTTSGNWVKSARPAGITKVVIEVQGGGAGGSTDATYQYACGGSAGGYAMKSIDVSSVTQAVITVGLGGAGAVSYGVGVDGGDSSWLDTAHGGTSDIQGVKGVSVSGNYTTAAGGLGVNGDVNIQGGRGLHAYNDRGAGGSSRFGEGGGNGYFNRGGAEPASGYGSGGGGEVAGNPGTAGMPGLIIVWEYI